MTSTKTSLNRRCESALATLISKAYWAALMLTGSSGTAESVVTDCIGSLDGQHVESGCLFTGVLELALKRDPGEPGLQAGYVRDRQALPPELALVLRLPDRLRQCFVLVFLLGLSTAECARLLRVDPDMIRQRAAAAAEELAALDEQTRERTNTAVLTHGWACQQAQDLRVV